MSLSGDEFGGDDGAASRVATACLIVGFGVGLGLGVASLTGLVDVRGTRD